MKIDKCIKEQDTIYTYDYYVPINVIFGQGDCISSFVIFKFGDQSIFEIGFDMVRKNICYITLTSCNPGIIKYGQPNTNIKSVKYGCPVLSIESKGEYFIECNEPFKVYIDDNALYITFSDIVSTNCIRNQSVEFLLDDTNNLVSIGITEISPNNLSMIKESIFS